MRDGNYDFEVLSAGKRLDEHSSEDCEVWIAGMLGASFELRVKNRSVGRTMACCSVDGLSVMTGEPSDGKLHGYIVGANSTLVIPGWRLDEDNIAQFEFTESAKSYASQMGQKNEKQGYLICSIYQEQVVPPEPPKPVEIAEVDEGPAYAPLLRSAPANRDQGLFSRSADTGSGDIDFNSLLGDDEAEPNNIGVGFGKKTEHHSRTVSFKIDPAITPVVIEIRYDTTRGLERRGMGCAVPPGWDTEAFESPSYSGHPKPPNMECRIQGGIPEKKSLASKILGWFRG